MGKRICVFGDSIAWGADDLKDGGWVNKFKVFFKKTGKFNEVFSLGIPGDLSIDLLKRIKNECKVRIEPKYKNISAIIIQIGLNDSEYIIYENRTIIMPNKFKKNIQKLIKFSKKFVPNIIFVGIAPVDESKVNPIPWSKSKSYKNEYIKKYNEIIKQECKKNKVYFIDIFEKWAKTSYKKFLEDGVHLNSEGHKRMFDTIKDYLIKNKII